MKKKYGRKSFKRGKKRFGKKKTKRIKGYGISRGGIRL